MSWSALVPKLSSSQGSGLFIIALHRFKKVQMLIDEKSTHIDIKYLVLPMLFLNFAWLSMVSSDFIYYKSLFSYTMVANNIVIIKI